jgi:hypothetical protein
MRAQMSPLSLPQGHGRAYEVALVDAPGDGRADRTFGDPTDHGTVHSLLVSPYDRSAWTVSLTVAEHGEGGVDGLFGTPSPTWACVVVHGSAFLVDVLDPAVTSRVRTDGPVRQVLELADEGLLLLATAWSIIAIGAGSVLWMTDRLSVESLRLDAVADHRLQGVADPEDEARDFTVDLRTGAVDGGSARRPSAPL